MKRLIGGGIFILIVIIGPKALIYVGATHFLALIILGGLLLIGILLVLGWIILRGKD